MCVEPELSPCVHLEKHTNSTNNTPIVIQKKILNEPLPAFPPSLRLKEPQTKLTSLIPPERLHEISLQDFWRSHAPRGASISILFLILKHGVRSQVLLPCVRNAFFTKLEKTHARNFLKETVEHVLLAYPKPCVKHLPSTCLVKNP